jgi:hypothetical protein
MVLAKWHACLSNYALQISPRLVGNLRKKRINLVTLIGIQRFCRKPEGKNYYIEANSA